MEQKERVEKGPCHRCQQFGHLIKDCPTWPVREVEEEEKSEIDWACMIEEEALELNAADEEKQSRDNEFDSRGLSEFAKKQVEERRKKLSSHSHGGVAKERDSNPHEALAASERKGLEPKWRKAIDGGYRLRFVMDSGAAKTIVP